jgi:hypothetical protein
MELSSSDGKSVRRLEQSRAQLSEYCLGLSFQVLYQLSELPIGPVSHATPYPGIGGEQTPRFNLESLGALERHLDGCSVYADSLNQSNYLYCLSRDNQAFDHSGDAEAIDLNLQGLAKTRQVPRTRHVAFKAKSRRMKV